MDYLKQKDNYDYIFVPNVLHHYPNPFDLFKEEGSSNNSS